MFGMGGSFRWGALKGHHISPNPSLLLFGGSFSLFFCLGGGGRTY